jgi:murein DD-endopeptidase MepM/ murein hydrolase activator NlpD
MRIVLAVVAVTLFGIVAIALSGPRMQTRGAPTPIPFHTVIPSTATPFPPPSADRRVRPDAALAGRFIVPVEDIDVPTDPELLPDAPRDYRAGIHEGIDFPAPMGAAVRAAASGTVVRVDTQFVDWSLEQQEVALSDALRLGYTPAGTLDRIRGRQVWIDHGRGIVTRYAHLSAVEAIVVGQRIEAGAPIGEVGSSGYPQGGPHLHFEVRIGDDYFGDGLAPDALVRAVARLFVSG